LIHIRFHIHQLGITNCETLFGKKFDLCVSNMCFSEFTVSYLDILLRNVLKNCKYASIFDTVKPEFAVEKLGKKLLRYSKFKSVECILYPDFYLPNHGLFFASRN